MLNYLLERLKEKYGKFHHLILWSDNSPSQFKECYLFFYLDYLVNKKEFLRIDLKFLLEGHSYSICDRRFGCIQQFFNSQEKIETPQQWALILQSSSLKNVQTYWVNLRWIMDYKSYLRMKYIARSEDIENTKFEVRRIAFINYGYGEIVDREGNLQQSEHTDTAFIRFTMDTREKPTIVSFVKKKQGVAELNSEDLVQLRHENRAVRDEVKQTCIKLAEKYLSETAKRFYSSLTGTSQDNDDDD